MIYLTIEKFIFQANSDISHFRNKNSTVCDLKMRFVSVLGYRQSVIFQDMTFSEFEKIRYLKH